MPHGVTDSEQRRRNYIRPGIMSYRSKIIIEDFYKPVVWSKQPRYTPGGATCSVGEPNTHQLSVHNIPKKISQQNKTQL